MSFETLMFTSGGGFVFGALAGYAIKKVLKIAAVVVGLFIAGMAYLAYRGWISVNWVPMENQAKQAMYNATSQVLHVINQTTTTISQHSTTAGIGDASMIVAGMLGFLPGLYLGFRKG